MMKNHKFIKCFLRSPGFTLIELLVVIAILGVLAGSILIAINPLEQLARGRDAGRKSTVAQLGSAVQSYFTSQNVVYPTQGISWMTSMQTSGELKVLPSNPTAGSYATGCNTPNIAENGFCYQTNGTDAIVYARAESKSSFTSAGCVGNQVAWVVWSSAEGRTGLLCMSIGQDPPIGATGLK